MKNINKRFLEWACGENITAGATGRPDFSNFELACGGVSRLKKAGFLSKIKKIINGGTKMKLRETMAEVTESVKEIRGLVKGGLALLVDRLDNQRLEINSLKAQIVCGNVREHDFVFNRKDSAIVAYFCISDLLTFRCKHCGLEIEKVHGDLSVGETKALIALGVIAKPVSEKDGKEKVKKGK